jgi:hypothetical protein
MKPFFSKNSRAASFVAVTFCAASFTARISLRTSDSRTLAIIAVIQEVKALPDYFSTQSGDLW